MATSYKSFENLSLRLHFSLSSALLPICSIFMNYVYYVYLFNNVRIFYHILVFYKNLDLPVITFSFTKHCSLCYFPTIDFYNWQSRHFSYSDYFNNTSYIVNISYTPSANLKKWPFVPLSCNFVSHLTAFFFTSPIIFLSARWQPLVWIKMRRKFWKNRNHDWETSITLEARIFCAVFTSFSTLIVNGEKEIVIKGKMRV